MGAARHNDRAHDWIIDEFIYSAPPLTGTTQFAMSARMRTARQDALRTKGATMRVFTDLINTVLNTICTSFFEGGEITYPVVNDHVTLQSLQRGFN
jgi:hypothetical protein